MTQSLKTLSERPLDMNKGVIISFQCTGTGMYQVDYHTNKGDNKTLTVQLDTGESTTDVYYAHVDDKTNEVLVLSKTPFPY